MKSLILKLLNKLGYEISKAYSSDGSYDPYSSIKLQYGNVVDLDALADISTSIPGMISHKSGQFLYSLCYFQEIEGDVVEIGSWQGRSTSFLARAVQNSDNGNFFAIDHFRGNVGKENAYIVDREDLSDLEKNFVANMKRVGLSEHVTLLNMPNHEAILKLGDIGLRFLFIDGDHTKEGVEKDIELFFPLLLPGAIIVFDDFSRAFPELIEAVDKLTSERKFSKIMTYKETLVLKL